jgi:hypothetical protein
MSKSYFGFWVAIAFVWGHFAFCVTVILPVWEVAYPMWVASKAPPARAPEGVDLKSVDYARGLVGFSMVGPHPESGMPQYAYQPGVLQSGEA